jgi:hypothetical protein
MGNIIKYIWLLLKFKDVRKIYNEENGTDKPGWASKRFIGAMVLFGGVVAQMLFGVEINSNTLSTLSDNFTTLAGAAQVIIPVAVQLYGATLSVVGAVKKTQLVETKETPGKSWKPEERPLNIP